MHISMVHIFWNRVRAAYGATLERLCGVKPTGSSNLPVSAISG